VQKATTLYWHLQLRHIRNDKEFSFIVHVIFSVSFWGFVHDHISVLQPAASFVPSISSTSSVNSAFVSLLIMHTMLT